MADAGREDKVKRQATRAKQELEASKWKRDTAAWALVGKPAKKSQGKSGSKWCPVVVGGYHNAPVAGNKRKVRVEKLFMHRLLDESEGAS